MNLWILLAAVLIFALLWWRCVFGAIATIYRNCIGCICTKDNIGKYCSVHESIYYPCEW